ncbi:hypothetical protein [Cupriavidus basilensis]|uniref:Uncharacterized protein n=1 Tax=Cupriavidus basilensis TaxID=68895 RepID=A0A7M2H7Y0_9BURK|nr:hypothetical protein [Cupriavidus basilensis]QOT81060.1 hypothetical protein F7R26_027205 [Cupriavidus basilensis]
MGEELTEFCLDVHAHGAEQEGDQRRQGELALPGESRGTLGMAGEVVNGLGVQIVGKGGEQFGQGHEGQAKIEKRSAIGHCPCLS